MIHLNRGKNTPHEWITEKEFEKRYPELTKSLREKVDGNEHGAKLKALRIKNRITVHELSKTTAIGSAEICDIENGRKEITAEINDRYCLGLNSAVRHHVSLRINLLGR